MEVNVTPVNDGSAGVEVQQIDTTAQRGNDGVQAAPATQQPESNVQTPEENSKFAQIRRDYEAKVAAETQRAIDAEYTRLYGEEYGVKSKADYDRLVTNQKFKQQYGFDRQPLEELAREEARRMLENDPTLAQMRQQNHEQQYEKDLREMQAIDPSFKTRDDLLAFAAREDVYPMLVERGMTPKQAYLLLNHDQIVAREKESARVAALKSVQRNGDTSPGPIGGGTEQPLSITSEQLQSLDQRRLMTDPAYLSAALDANAKRFKKG